MNKKVAIITLNWNTSDYTINLIKSLGNSSFSDFSLFILDNGSKKEDYNNLKKFIDAVQNLDIKLIRSEKNLGFAGGNNFVFFNFIERENFKYVLFINNDTTVEKDFLKKLIARIEKDERIGSIGPLILRADNRKLIDSAGADYYKKIVKVKLRCHLKSIKKCKKYLKESFDDFITGACLLVRKNIFKELKGFDEKFFAYSEDVDLGIRIKKLGYLNLFFPEAVIYHHGSVSTKGKKEFYYYLNLRNKVYIGRKHNSKIVFYTITLFYIIFVKYLLNFLISFDINLLKGGFKGIKDGFRL